MCMSSMQHEQPHLARKPPLCVLRLAMYPESSCENKRGAFAFAFAFEFVRTKGTMCQQRVERTVTANRRLEVFLVMAQFHVEMQ